MSTINAVLEPDIDGTLHLPLPPELRHGKVHITARLESATVNAPKPGSLRGFRMSPDFDEPLEGFKEYME